MPKLIILLKNNDYELTKKDIEKNKKYIGLKNKYGYTTLMLYLWFNENPSIKIIKLLKKEKNIFNDNNCTPLIFYCLNKNIKNTNLEEIIKYFSNQIGLKSYYHETALMFYLKYNKNPSMEFIKLLEKEKDIFDNNNETPLMYYCNNIFKYNLNKKIINYFSNQIGIKDKYGNTALSHYLKDNKNSKSNIIKLLDKEKDIFNDNNDTPLKYYLKYNKNPSIEIIEYFYNQIGVKDNNGTPNLYYYLNNRLKKINPDIIKLLETQIGYIDFKKYNVKIDLDIY